MINKALIIGNVCAEPEKRFTQAGKSVSTFTVATSEKWKGSDGQMREETEFHRCVAWDKLGDICAEYLHKGSRVYCEAKIRTRKWQAQDGSDRYSTELIVKEMKMLSPRTDSSNSNCSSQEPSYGGGYVGDTGDEIPFAPAI